MWRKTECYNEEQPVAVEMNHDTVFVRKNFEHLIPNSEEELAKWVYDEAEISLASYALYQDQVKQDNAIDELTIAILEG